MSKKQQVKAAPIILDVHDGQQTVPNGGTTDAAQLTLSGSAEANSVILLYDHEAPVGSASVTINSTWAITLSVEMGEHRFTARTPSGHSSVPWGVTREESRLSIDTSEMVLDGNTVKFFLGTPTGIDAPGNTEVRTATGGVRPYTYSSSHPDVASVSAQGKVTGEGNGSAVITVQDSRQQSVSYAVTVNNVWILAVVSGQQPGDKTYQEAEDLLLAFHSYAPSGHFLSRDDMSLIFQRYARPYEFIDTGYWIEKESSNPAKYAYFSMTLQDIVVTLDPATPNIEGLWCGVDKNEMDKQMRALETAGCRVKLA